MSTTDDILQRIPMDQLAAQLGVDPATAQQAAAAAIPQLLGSLQHNAAAPGGEQGLATALADHAEHGVDVDHLDVNQIDTADGDKIVGHLLGGNTQHASQQAAQQAGVDNSLIQKLLPILAPIVLAYIGSQISKNGGFGNVLGQVLGGGGLGGALGGGQGHQQPAPQQPSIPQPAPQQPAGQQAPTFPGFPGSDQNAQADPQSDAPASQQKSGGGILSQILGSILGGGH